MSEDSKRRVARGWFTNLLRFGCGWVRIVCALLMGSVMLTWESAQLFAKHAEEASISAAELAFREGQAAFARGDYASAGLAFDRAHDAAPHHSALWNAALSYERAGDEVLAANRYLAFLSGSQQEPDHPDRGRATLSLKELSTRVGRIDVVAIGAVRKEVDGIPIRLATVYVAPGGHRVSAVFVEPGLGERVVAKEVSVAAAERVSVNLSASVTPPLAPNTVSPSRPDVVQKQREQGTMHEERRSPSVWPLVVIGTLTGATFAFTVASGIDVLVTKDEFDREVLRGVGVGLQQIYIDQGIEKTTRTNVLLGVTGALGIASGITLAFTVGGSEAAPPRAREDSRGPSF